MDVLVNRLKLLAESLGSMQSRLAVFSHESQQRFPLHEIDLTRHGSLRRQLTRSTGNHRAQAEHLTRSGNLQDENFAVFRSSGKFYFARAQHEYSSWHLAFDEQQRASRQSTYMADVVEVL